MLLHEFGHVEAMHNISGGILMSTGPIVLEITQSIAVTVGKRSARPGCEDGDN